MEQKLKECFSCKKLKPIWKNISGKPHCKICAEKLQKQKVKEKKAKIRQKKKETITEKKLDQIFSLLVRNVYPPFCHSSRVPIEVVGSHCAHLISRQNRCTRFDLRNCYPTTPQENMFNQLHVIQLAKRLKEYYDIEIEDWEQSAKQTLCKLNKEDKLEMFNIFKEGLEKALSIKKSSVDQESELKTLREDIIQITKRIM